MKGVILKLGTEIEQIAYQHIFLESRNQNEKD